MPTMTLDEIEAWLAELEEMYQREQRQAIMQRNMEKAVYALAGQESCDRLRKWLELRLGMRENAVAVMKRKARG